MIVYKDDKQKKTFVSWHHEERHYSAMFVCLEDLLNLFLKILACSTHKTKVSLVERSNNNCW